MAPGRSAQRSELGAWLLKGNPVARHLRGFLDSGEERVTSSSVQPGYRSALMAAGDRVLFWVSGDGRSGFPRGVWGLGHILAEPEPWSEATRGFWRAADGHHGIRARVEVDIALLDEAVPDRELPRAGVDDLEV